MRVVTISSLKDSGPTVISLFKDLLWILHMVVSLDTPS